MDEDFRGGDGDMNTGGDPLCMILYRVQNKLSLVGGHYEAPMVKRGGREPGRTEKMMPWGRALNSSQLLLV